MKVLVLNSGSSSLKFQLLEMAPEQEQLLAHGAVSRIGSQDATVSFEAGQSGKVKSTRPILKYDQALAAGFECLTASGITKLEDITGVGHRVVHGGEYFHASVIIDDDVLRRIESVSELAPLHNPPNLEGYRAAKALLPQATHVAVFDTAFHHTLPQKAYLYGLPYVYYTSDKIRRYGFHGTSHRYLSERFALIHGKSSEAYKLITCHLGNGCSVCAIDAGKSVDTSMGFTPLEGLLMGTRSGDLDPGAMTYLAARDGGDLVKIEKMLNEQSGLSGISGVSNDMQEVQAEAEKGNKRAEAAIQVFCYRVTKYIGAYFAALNGVDAIIFAGGIGENAAPIRARICERLSALGITLDAARNDDAIGKEQEISTAGASLGVWVIPTDEELVIARDTMRAILKT